MRNYPFPLAAVLALLIACSSQAAEKPHPAQGIQNQPKKVWTNDDMDQLRARGLISIVGQEPTESAAQAPEEAAENTFPVYPSRLDDPEWYAEKAADLQAELDDRLAALEQEKDALALAKDQRITEPGVALNKPSIGVTPEAAIDLLEAQVQDVQSQLDELSDLARQHDIPPGVLRS
ncbi:MAG TPA: hypothetical protein VGP19_05830 [Candidatus Acidoferrales bacterium]|jgi:hypothetical protein|nr:hypothetical protein [Candidatus Acidoferrales bacterium]